MPANIKPLTATLLASVILAALLSTGGCTDERALRRQAVAAQMQQVSEELRLARGEVDFHLQRLAELAAENQACLEQRNALTQHTKAYMLDHKMAVAALAAGAAGGMAVFSEDPGLSDEARKLGAMVGVAALLWAAFNADEMAEVLSHLDQASHHGRQLEQRKRSIAQAAEEMRSGLEVAQHRLAEASSRAALLRTAYEAA